MASHDKKKLLKPWIGKSWEKFRGATTPGGAVSPGDVDEFDVVPRSYSETPEEKEFYGNEIPPEVAELKKAAEGPSGLSGGTIERPAESLKSPVPAAERAERPGESTRVTSGVPGVTAEPASPEEWDRTLKTFRGRVKEEMAKEKPVFSDETFGADIRSLETVPKDYLGMAMATGGKPGYGAAMDSEGHITAGTPSGRMISTRPGAALEDAQQEILGRVNYLQNTPVEKQYQDYLAENKRQYPKGPITTKLNKWGTTSTEGEPLDFKTFKKDIGRRIDDGLGSLERLSGTKKEAPSAVPRPFEFSTDYQNLYGKVKEWLQNPREYKKELAVAVPLLDKMAQHEINAYRESGATGSLGISPVDAAKIAKDISVIPSDIEYRKAQTGELRKKTEAIPSDIEKTKAETAKLIRESETKTGSRERMGLLTAALKATEDEMLADPTTKASNAEMRKLIMARIKEILGGKTAGEEEKPPMEGATKGTDGKWYVPDPKRPGKFLMVGQ